MQDEELIEQFENCSLTEFHHRDHVRLTWLYLARNPLPVAMARITAGLRRFAAAKGKPERYHETITCAFLFLINERRGRQGEAQSWLEFAEQNRDLCNWQENILARYYHPETLASDLARQIFLLPDRI